MTSPRSLIAFVLLASSTVAQTQIATLAGDPPAAFLGYSVRCAGDVDGDAVEDLVVGAPGSSSVGGYVRVHSGADWSVIHQFTGIPGDDFVTSVCGLGDVDGDGRPDLAIGAPGYPSANYRGRVFTFSGATGASLGVLEGLADFDWFGTSCAPAGDVDNDGQPDLLVGALSEGPVGAVWVFSYQGGTSWSVLWHVTDVAPTRFLGQAVDGIGDVDLDGFDDFAAGAPESSGGATLSGRVCVFSGRTGLKLYEVDGATAGEQFGWSVRGTGDVNADGRPDFVVGGPYGAAQFGVARVLSGPTGTVLRELTGTVPLGGFGWSVGSAGDFDADGSRDVLVGALNPNTGAGGYAQVYSIPSGALVLDLEGESAHYGHAVDGGFDLDGDGCSELIVGSPYSDQGLGEAHVYSCQTFVTSYCQGDGSATPCPCGNVGQTDEGCANSSGAGASLGWDGSISVGIDDLVLDVESLLPNQPALLFAGLNATNGGAGIPFGDGLRCAGGSVVRLGVEVPDSSGEADWGPGMAAVGGWGAGDTRRFQAWYRDPSGPCSSGFNLSNGIEVVFGV